MTLSDEHCQAIGKISVAFAEIEMWVKFFAWALIGPDQSIGQIVTAEMSLKQLLDLLGSLFHHRCQDKERNDFLKSLIDRINEAGQTRNRTLHSLWIRQSKEPREAIRLKITSKRKKGLSHSKEVVTPEDLNTLAKEFQTVLSDFSTFMTTYLARQ